MVNPPAAATAVTAEAATKIQSVSPGSYDPGDFAYYGKKIV